MAASALATFLALAGAGPIAAGEEPCPRARIEALEDRVRELEAIIRRHGLDRAARPAPETPPVTRDAGQEAAAAPAPVLAGWQDGFFVRSADGAFALDLGGYLQTDGRFFVWDAGDTGTDSFFLRRARPVFEGTVYRYFAFKLMPDFGDGRTVLQDAYVDVGFWPAARLRVGKFKTPFSLERLQSATDILFVERSIANNLAPIRDLGAQVFGEVLDGRFAYAAGIFNGVQDGGSSDGETGSDKEFAGRVFAQPFRHAGVAPLAGLGFGVAGTAGRQTRESLTGLGFRSAGRATFFRYGTRELEVVADGTHWRVAPQLAYYGGPLRLMGEYLVSTQRVAPAGNGEAAGATLRHDAWFAQASYVLTGEAAASGGVVPRRPFDPAAGGVGAFEVAARIARLDLDTEAFRAGLAQRSAAAAGAWAYTAGVNWYLNQAVRVQLNYERTDLAAAVAFGTDERDHEDVLLTRFQLVF